MSETSAGNAPWDPQSLIVHTRFLRALARRLVGEAAADDVVQDTFLTALERPPENVQSPRAWLGRIAGRIAFARRRSDDRRARREAECAVGTTGSASDPVKQQSVLKELVDAVLALADPYRRTVMERYFEDLPPRAIARRHGIPVATVYSHLKRAHHQLRERLDTSSGGDRRRWVGGLCALFGRPEPAVAGVLVGTVAKIVLGATVVALIAFAWREDTGPSRQPETAAREPTGSTNASPPTPAGDVADTAVAREETPLTDDAARPRTLHGRVVDDLQSPVPDASVELIRFEDTFQRVDPGAALPTTNADGGFEWTALPPGKLYVRVRSTEHSSVVLEVPEESIDGKPMLIVLNRGAAVHGTVLDRDGRPAVGVELRLAAGRRLSDAPRPVVTDAEGRYAMADLHSGAIVLECAAEGQGRARGEVRVGPGQDMVCDLRLVPELYGRVVDDAGEGRADLLVKVIVDAPGSPETESTTTDEKGEFAFRGLPFNQTTLMVFVPPLQQPRVPVWSEPQVFPRDDPWVITVPDSALESGAVFGQLRAPPEADVSSARIFAWYARRQGAQFEVAEDGRFQLAPLNAGHYFLELFCPGTPSWTLAEIELGPGERRDLGIVDLPRPGTILPRLRSEEIPSTDLLTFAVLAANRLSSSWSLVGGVDEIRQVKVAPGEYSCACWQNKFELGEPGFAAITTVTVDEGEQKIVDVPSSSSESITVNVVGVSDLSEAWFVAYRIEDGEGSTLLETSMPRPRDTPCQLCLLLDPGAYRVIVTAGTAKKGHIDLRVDGSGRGREIDLEMK